MASAAGAISTAVEGTNTCNFGRRCGTLQVNGVDVGATLISEGLAVRFVCGATSCPKLPRPLLTLATGSSVDGPQSTARGQDAPREDA
jgi:hypothetical protein